MEINSRNVIRHELIGLEVKVKDSNHSALRNIRGLIIDETMNMLTIQRGDKKMSIPKSTSQLSFVLKGRELTVDGKALVGRPEERIKAKKRIWLFAEQRMDHPGSVHLGEANSFGRADQRGIINCS